MKPLEGAISAFFDKDAPEHIKEMIRGGKKNDMLATDFPFRKRWKKRDYEAAMAKLQVELVKFQYWVKNTGERVAIVFEGRDAAGKGGTIKRFRENLNPRGARVVALGAPTETEANQWYFQRYIQHLPTKGEIVLFDRSWYNRAVVEHVFGFCTSTQRDRFFEQVPQFEAMLNQEGIRLHKLWLTLGRSEQLKRFLDRERDPLKGWKLSEIDAAGLSKWSQYSAAIIEMFDKTHHDRAPWTVVLSDDKRRARVQAILHVLNQYDYDDKDESALEGLDPNLCGGPEIWRDRS